MKDKMNELQNSVAEAMGVSYGMSQQAIEVEHVRHEQKPFTPCKASENTKTKIQDSGKYVRRKTMNTL
jgi:hypothetical protein